jgi:hypothetical protein
METCSGRKVEHPGGDRPHTRPTGGWVGRRVVLDGMVKRKMAVPVRNRAPGKFNDSMVKLLTERRITFLQSHERKNTNTGCPH